MSEPEIFSYCVSLVSIAVAVWQTIKNNNLKKYITAEAMKLYSETGMLLGSLQSCLKELQAGNINLAGQDAGRAEGFGQALFQSSIKNISHHFDYTSKDIDDWITKKKIEEHHKNAFLKYSKK